MTPTFYWQQTVPPNLQMGEETVHQAMHTVFACGVPPFFFVASPRTCGAPLSCPQGLQVYDLRFTCTHSGGGRGGCRSSSSTPFLMEV